MRAVAENHAWSCRRSDCVADGDLDAMRLEMIGEELRDFYGSVAQTGQPHALLELAEAIDAARGGLPQAAE